MASIFILFMLSPCLIHGLGRHNFECPDGFYLNIVNSIYGSDHRMYSFGCAPLTNGEINDEKCEPGKISATNTNDMYMTCDDSQYVAGLSIVEDSTHQMWSLLCCQSPDVVISNECSSTVFLNQYQNSFSFASGAKHILRKWQSVYDAQKKDRRWWLQTCPFSTAPPSANNHTGSVMDFKRKVVFPFDSNRIDAVRSSQRNFIKQHSIDDKPILKKISKSLNVSESHETNSSTTTLAQKITSISTLLSSSISTSLSTTKHTQFWNGSNQTSTIIAETKTYPTLSWLQRSSTLSPKTPSTSFSNSSTNLSINSTNKTFATKPTLAFSSSTNYTTFVPQSTNTTSQIMFHSSSNYTNTTTKNASSGEKFVSYDDYYGSSVANEKHSKSNDSRMDSKLENIFKGLHKVFKNIQDGLVLAQWVLSNNDDDTTETVAKNVPKFGNDIGSTTKPFPISKDDKIRHGSSAKQQKSVLQNVVDFLGINAHKMN